MSKNRLALYARGAISLAAFIIPLLLLAKGIFGSFLFTFSVPLLWHVGVRGGRLNTLGITKGMLAPALFAGGATGLFLGVLGGIVITRCGMTGYTYADVHTLGISVAHIDISFALQNELGYRLLSMGTGPAGSLIFFLFCIFVIGIGEELFWRGFIQQLFSRSMTRPRSVWLTAAFFGMLHCYFFTVLPVGKGTLFLVLIALAGAFWGYLFERFRSLWAPALSHGIAAFILWKYYFFTP